MASSSSTVRRTLQLRFTLPAANASHLLALIRAAAPFLQAFGGKRSRLLQNVDDPAQFLQVIEYETLGALETNRQRIASDPRLQGYLQAWRAFMPGAVEMDVYQDTTA